MEGTRRRQLNRELNKEYAYIPPFVPQPQEQGGFDEYTGYTPGTKVDEFPEDVAAELEALKVYVWRQGGPQNVGVRGREAYGKATEVVETCDIGECKQYLPSQLHPCYKCGRRGCYKHIAFLVGEWCCPTCEMVLRSVE